jgi:hypothetical protein
MCVSCCLLCELPVVQHVLLLHCYVCVCYFYVCGCGMLFGCGCGMFPVMCMQKGAKCYRNLHLNELFLYFFKFSVRIPEPIGFGYPNAQSETPWS